MPLLSIGQNEYSRVQEISFWNSTGTTDDAILTNTAFWTFNGSITIK